MNNASFLKEHGFNLAGNIALNMSDCATSNEFIKASLLSLSDAKDFHDVVYVYLVDGRIVYVGESGESFATRFTRHIRGVSQKAPIPSRVRWKELLTSNGSAQIYIHKCGVVDYFGEEVSPRVGFESALITKFNPPLNSPRKAQKIKMAN